MRIACVGIVDLEAIFTIFRQILFFHLRILILAERHDIFAMHFASARVAALCAGSAPRGACLAWHACRRLPVARLGPYPA